MFTSRWDRDRRKASSSYPAATAEAFVIDAEDGGKRGLGRRLLEIGIVEWLLRVWYRPTCELYFLFSMLGMLSLAIYP